MSGNVAINASPIEQEKVPLKELRLEGGDQQDTMSKANVTERSTDKEQADPATEGKSSPEPVADDTVTLPGDIIDKQTSDRVEEDKPATNEVVAMPTEAEQTSDAVLVDKESAINKEKDETVVASTETQVVNNDENEVDAGPSPEESNVDDETPVTEEATSQAPSNGEEEVAKEEHSLTVIANDSDEVQEMALEKEDPDAEMNLEHTDMVSPSADVLIEPAVESIDASVNDAVVQSVNQVNTDKQHQEDVEKANENAETTAPHLGENNSPKAIDSEPENEQPEATTATVKDSKPDLADQVSVEQVQNEKESIVHVSVEVNDLATTEDSPVLMVPEEVAQSVEGPNVIQHLSESATAFDEVDYAINEKIARENFGCDGSNNADIAAIDASGKADTDEGSNSQLSSATTLAREPTKEAFSEENPFNSEQVANLVHPCQEAAVEASLSEEPMTGLAVAEEVEKTEDAVSDLVRDDGEPQSAGFKISTLNETDKGTTELLMDETAKELNESPETNEVCELEAVVEPLSSSGDSILEENNSQDQTPMTKGPDRESMGGAIECSCTDTAKSDTSAVEKAPDLAVQSATEPFDAADSSSLLEIEIDEEEISYEEFEIEDEEEYVEYVEEEFEEAEATESSFTEVTYNSQMDNDFAMEKAIEEAALRAEAEEHERNMEYRLARQLSFHRKDEDFRRRLAEEKAEHIRQEEERERQRVAEQERLARIRAEEAAVKIAQQEKEELRRLLLEEETRRIAAEAEAHRLAAEAVAREKQMAEQARHIAEEKEKREREAKKREMEEEVRRLQARLEEAKRAAEEVKQRKKSEALTDERRKVKKVKKVKKTKEIPSEISQEDVPSFSTKFPISWSPGRSPGTTSHAASPKRANGLPSPSYQSPVSRSPLLAMSSKSGAPLTEATVTSPKSPFKSYGSSVRSPLPAPSPKCSVTPVPTTPHKEAAPEPAVKDSPPPKPAVRDMSDGNIMYYTADQLRRKEIPGLDYKNRENYLHPDEFREIFEMTREEFNELPKWKQTNMKRKQKLF